jgi:hypothetical protein
MATLGFNGFFTLLSINFEYPDILRSPTSYVLTQYHAGGSALTLQWYGMVFVSMLLIPCVIFLHHLIKAQGLLGEQDHAFLSLGTVFGVLASLMNILGFIRWVFVVPALASQYVDPVTTQASKEAIEIVFNAFHLYAGFSIGEHLGYIFTGLWAIFAGFAMLRSSLFRPWLGWIGIVAGPLVIFGSLEGAGIPFAADVNVVGFAVWSLWLIATGISLLLAKSQPTKQRQSTLSPTTVPTT